MRMRRAHRIVMAHYLNRLLFKKIQTIRIKFLRSTKINILLKFFK